MSGHPFLIPILDRVTAETGQSTTLRLGTPCASSSDCLTFPLLSRVSLLFPWAGDTHTHTHTHTGDTSTHVYTHTGSIRGHKKKQGTNVIQELKMPMSSNGGDGISRHHVLHLELSVHLLPEHLPLFRRQPEASSSAASVVLVRH